MGIVRASEDSCNNAARGATVIIPPAKTANISGHGPRSPARDRTITLVKTLGRRQWKQASGYHRQGLVENTFFRYKSIIGDGLRARSPAGQGRCCMKTRCGWGGVARTSRDAPQEPHYRDEVEGPSHV